MCDFTCGPDYEQECICLRKELDQTLKRLNECSRLLNEAQQDLETLKIAYDEQREELIRLEAQVDAFKYVISERR